MRIENAGSVSGVRSKKKKSQAAGASGTFSLDSSTEVGVSGASAPNVTIANLDALLMLQDVEESVVDRQKAAKQGFDLLDQLEELRLALLVGRLSHDQIERVATKVRGLGTTGDDELDSIMSDIDMRAKVELAKLGIYDV